MPRLMIPLLALLVGLAAAPRTALAAETPARRLSVFVSILPQEGIVRRIAGDRATVQVLVQPGQNPHTYSPAPRQIMQLSKADLYFCIHVPFEEQLMPRIRANMPALQVVDTCASIEFLPMADGHEQEEATNGEAHEEDHDHTGADPHTWLDPRLAQRQAQTIRDALIQRDPAGAQEYTKNFDGLARDLDRLDAQIREQLAPFRGEAFLVFHPSFGYFAKAYGLRQLAIEIEGKAPTPRQLKEIITVAQEQEIRIIFVQPQFDQANARAIAEAIGGVAVTLDPLAADYLENLRRITLKIRKTLSPPAVPAAALIRQ